MPSNKDVRLERDEKELFVWNSLSRVHKERGVEFFSTIFVLGLILSVIMFLVDGLISVFLIWSVVFVVWVLAKNPPDRIKNRVTSLGIRTIGELYKWEEMAFYWFEKNSDSELLRVVLRRRFPNQLGLVVAKKDKDKLDELMSKNVEMRVPKKGVADKALSWLAKTLPLEGNK